MNRSHGCLLLALIVLVFAGCTPVVKPDSSPDSTPDLAPGGRDSSPARSPAIRDGDLSEISGIAASHYSSGHYWLHNDSGGRATVYRITATGERAGHVQLIGVKNVDWEDIAAFSSVDNAFLLIGDIGDNGAERDSIRLHVLAEPDPQQRPFAQGISVKPEYSLTVQYADGPRDAEALAVDVRAGQIYILTKRDSPPRLYRLPLAQTTQPVVAEFVTELPQHPQATLTDILMDPRFGPYRYSPTAMDINAAGNQAVVLGYHHVFVYPRKDGESWAQAFQKKPTVLTEHQLRQAEAVSFTSDDNSVIYTTEALPAPLNLIEFSH